MRFIISNIVLAVVLGVLIMSLTGCANVNREVTTVVVKPDGTTTTTTDKMNMSSTGQDFKGSDISFSQKIGGTTTMKAGAIDNTISPVTGESTTALVGLIEKLIEMKAVTPTP